MARRVHIVIAEPSLIIRSGIVSVLKRLSAINIDIAEISEISSLISQASDFKPDILIIDPSHIGFMSVSSMKNEIGDSKLKIVALQNSLFDNAILKQFDDVIGLFDSSDMIKEKIVKLTSAQDIDERKQELSVREKEIVICVVKGMTNKQIAEKLFLSTHTIMTHRRNIVNKLQIHSTSGLTIYAILTKLVMIDEVKNTIFTKK